MIRIERSDSETPSPTSWPVGFSAVWTDDDSPAKIFVLQTSGTSVLDAAFSCVASEIQMRDLPEDAAGDSGPFFRVAEFTSIFRTETAILEFQQSLLDAVQELVDERTAAGTLELTSVFEIQPTTV